MVTRRAFRYSLMLAAATTLVGCDSVPSSVNQAPDPAAAPLFAVTATGPEAQAALRLLNHPWTSWTVLHQEVRLDPEPAYQLVAYRDGADCAPGTVDDQAFESLSQIGAVGNLDDEAVGQLVAWAVRRAWLPGEDPQLGVFDGVEFRLGEAEQTVTAANGAPASVLDQQAGLYANAVTAIVAARPIASLADLAGLDHMGSANLIRLKAFATSLAVWDEPACPARPMMTVAEAAAVDFEPGEFTVCLDAASCPTPEALDAERVIESIAGAPYWSQCRWQTSPACGPFAIGGAPCCYVVAVDTACH